MLNNINDWKTFKKYPTVYIIMVLCTDIDTLGVIFLQHLLQMW